MKLKQQLEEGTSRIVRQREALELLGISYSTFWRLRKRGDFPDPIRLTSRTNGYQLVDLSAWLEARKVRETETSGRNA